MANKEPQPKKITFKDLNKGEIFMFNAFICMKTENKKALILAGPVCGEYLDIKRSDVVKKYTLPLGFVEERFIEETVLTR